MRASSALGEQRAEAPHSDASGSDAAAGQEGEDLELHDLMPWEDPYWTPPEGACPGAPGICGACWGCPWLR